MNGLKEEDKQILKRICVRTTLLNKESNKYELGSGVLMYTEKTFYVLTAGHCIKQEEENIEIENIGIECYDGLEYKKAVVKNIIACKYTKTEDFAVLTIEKPISDFDYNNRCKILNMTVPEEKYFMLSFPPKARDGRIFDLNNNIDDKWEVSTEVNYAKDNFTNLIEGSSGAGIFTYRHGVFYYVGLVTKTRDSIGRYNDIRAYNPNVFKEYIPSELIEIKYFDTIKLWEDWENKRSEDDLQKCLEKASIDWNKNLTRKLKVLYPRNYQNKIQNYRDLYIKGKDIIDGMSSQNPNFIKELNSDIDKYFKRKLDTHKEDFESSDAAHNDLESINKEIAKRVLKFFVEDKQYDVICEEYAKYKTTEKLLNCTLDYFPNDRT